MPRRPRTRGKKLRRAFFLLSVGIAVTRFALARRPKRAPAGRAEWPPLAPAPGPRSSATPAAAEPAVEAAIDPVEGACPASHPVKGNQVSGIYHLPGGQFYDSTAPDRCYRDAAAAEAEGLRASKR